MVGTLDDEVVDEAEDQRTRHGQRNQPDAGARPRETRPQQPDEPGQRRSRSGRTGRRPSSARRRHLMSGPVDNGDPPVRRTTAANAASHLVRFTRIHHMRRRHAGRDVTGVHIRRLSACEIRFGASARTAREGRRESGGPRKRPSRGAEGPASRKRPAHQERSDGCEASGRAWRDCRHRRGFRRTRGA